jgi:hypothetical protein
VTPDKDAADDRPGSAGTATEHHDSTGILDRFVISLCGGAPAAPRPLAVPGVGASTPGRSAIASPDAGMLTPSTYSTPKDTMVFLEYQAVGGCFLVCQLSVPVSPATFPNTQRAHLSVWVVMFQ